MSKRIIFHIIPHLVIGGAQTFLKLLIDNVSGWDHQILILDNQVSSQWKGYPIRKLNLIELLKVLRSEDNDDEIFHFHWFPPFQFRIPDSKKQKAIVTIQDNVDCQVRNASIYIASTLEGLRYTPNSLSSERKVVSPEIDLKKWTNSGLTRTKGRLVRHSTLYPEKLSFSCLEDICKYDQKKYFWQIIGVGDLGFISSLRDRCSLQPNIQLGESRDIPADLNQAWLYGYHTSEIGEHYGFCFQEALECGLPIVTDDQTGARHQIRHEVDGFICSSHAEMREKVNLLYENPDLYNQMVD